MRGIALVLTVAFVFASSALLVGPTSAQSTEPSSMPPEEYREEPTDAVIQGHVRDGSGNPVGGAQIRSYSNGPYYATGAEGGSASSDGSTGTARAYPCCYYGDNSATTAADGSFRLDVHSGDNQLSVDKEGFVSTTMSVSVSAGQTVTQDLTIEKIPDRTARLEGRVTDARTGKGIGFASVYVSNPRYGTDDCSIKESQGGGGGGVEPQPMPASDSGIAAPDSSYYYDRGCSITVHPDGTFEGMVTPGYSIVSVYAYADCYSTMDADGSSSNSCGPQYFGWARTLTLAADATTPVNVALRSHAAPDAVVSGYLIDAETGLGISGAQISFSNQETYGYGYATTDSHGSYSLRLRSGYHMVSVYAPGHFPWESTLEVKSGDSDFDVKLTPGEPSYGGGCCIYYADAKMGFAEGSSETALPPSAGGANAADGGADDAVVDSDSNADTEGTEEVLYQDLGGNLGPYDAAERQDALAEDDAGGLEDSPSNGAPGLGLFAVLGAIALALVALRRRA